MYVELKNICNSLLDFACAVATRRSFFSRSVSLPLTLAHSFCLATAKRNLIRVVSRLFVCLCMLFTPQSISFALALASLPIVYLMLSVDSSFCVQT